jgi:hypothetical protein
MLWATGKQLIEDLLDGPYPVVGTPGVAAAEDEPGLRVAALGAVQGSYDAESLAALLVGTFLQTTQVAGRLVIPVVSGDLIQITTRKWIASK